MKIQLLCFLPTISKQTSAICQPQSKHKLSHTNIDAYMGRGYARAYSGSTCQLF